MKILDLSGKKFNKLTVISKAASTRGGSITWNCICDCGNEKIISSDHLTRKRDPVKSCGCLVTNRGFKSGGRVKFEGSCVLCGVKESSRWYRKCVKEGTICRHCYQKERLKDDNIRAKRLRQRREWGEKNPMLLAKKLAKEKGMEFTLTEEQYFGKIKECYYCGDDLSKIKEGLKLDRLDSNKHYTDENTVGCCRMCNVAKNNHSLEKFLNWVKNLRVENIEQLACSAGGVSEIT